MRPPRVVGGQLGLGDRACPSRSRKSQPPLLHDVQRAVGTDRQPVRAPAGRRRRSPSCRRAAPGDAPAHAARRRARCRRASTTGPRGTRRPSVISVIVRRRSCRATSSTRLDRDRSRHRLMMARMKIRLEPQDEYMHTLESATNFNESMYFNVFDPTERVGGFLRLGNRANEGYAELTTCLYLPDGRVAFMFKRPEIDEQRRVRRGRHALRGRHAVRGAAHDVRRQGRAARRAAADGQPAARRSPTTRRSTRTSTSSHRGVSPMYGGEPVNDDGTPLVAGPLGRLRARPLRAAHGGHRARSASATKSGSSNGFGLRDHSWGPRFWQAPW